MNSVVSLLSWPVTRAANSLRAAGSLYASITVVAFAMALWNVSHTPAAPQISVGVWLIAMVLGMVGAWRVRLLQLGLRRQSTIAAVWPFAAIAVFGVIAKPLIGCLFVVALFEVLQARHVLHMAPADR